MLPQNNQQPNSQMYGEQQQYGYTPPPPLYQPQPIGIYQQPQQQYPQQQNQYCYGQGYQIGGDGYPPPAPQNCKNNYCQQIQLQDAKPDQVQVDIMMMEPQHPYHNANNVNLAILHPSYNKETHSHYPQQICCPSCNKIITTMIKYEIGVGTWAMVLCFLCFFWPLMCLPFCCQSMQDVVHYCPECNTFCGRKKFLC